MSSTFLMTKWTMWVCRALLVPVKQLSMDPTFMLLSPPVPGSEYVLPVRIVSNAIFGMGQSVQVGIGVGVVGVAVGLAVAVGVGVVTPPTFTTRLPLWLENPPAWK